VVAERRRALRIAHPPDRGRAICRSTRRFRPIGRAYSRKTLLNTAVVWNYDVVRDRRLVVLEPLPQSTAGTQLTFLVNVFDEIARRAPPVGR
jgi:hypothetical protein